MGKKGSLYITQELRWRKGLHGTDLSKLEPRKGEKLKKEERPPLRSLTMYHHNKKRKIKSRSERRRGLKTGGGKKKGSSGRAAKAPVEKQGSIEEREEPIKSKGWTPLRAGPRTGSQWNP